MTRVLVTIGLVLAGWGCASAGGPLVLTEDAVHDALAQVDDGVRATCSGVAGVLIKPACDDVRKVLIPTLEAGAAFNRCVAEQKIGCIAPLIEAGGRLTTELKKLPESNSVKLVNSLARALSIAYQATGGK